jgi:hypothetical protein
MGAFCKQRLQGSQSFHWPTLLTLLLALFTSAGQAQVNSNVANVTLTGTLLESLTVAPVPSAVSFNLVSAGTAAGSSAVAITTSWILLPTRTSVKLFGSFSSSTAALSDGAGDNIPSSAVLGQMPTGLPTSFTAFTQTVVFGAAGAGLALFNQTITILNFVGNRTDNLSLEIDLSATTVPAGTYTGTLHLEAQAL